MSAKNDPASKANAANEGAASREIVTTRVFDAPRELVFLAWTDPKHIAKWWGPNGFTNTIHEMDFRPGGVWRFTMHGPDGVDYPNKIVYNEIVAPELLAYTHGEHDDEPAHFEARVTFEREGAKTRLTMRLTFPTAARRDEAVEKYGAVEGGNQTLGRFAARLDEILADEAFVVTREFNAPRELVFKAWTDPEALAKWWGPKGMGLRVAKAHVRPGGVFLYCMSFPNGDFWGRMVYREVSPPERIVFVTSFSDEEGGVTRAPFFDGEWPLEVHNAVELTESGGRTTLTLRGVPINANEIERNKFKSNFESMRGGFGGTFDQLEEYLKG